MTSQLWHPCRHRPARLAGWIGVLTLLTAAGVPAPSGAQTDEPAVTRTVSRSDLSGVWWRYPQFGDKLDPTLPPPPPGDPPDPPLKAEYLRQWQAEHGAIVAAEQAGRPLYTHTDTCLPKDVLTIMRISFPFEFLQTPGRVTFIAETFHTVRRIYLDRRQIPVEEADPGFWGHSVGHWEGDDTLVVDTVGIKENARFMEVPHSAEMRIAERIRLLTPDFMRIDFEVTDPVYLTKPWRFAFTYHRYPERDYKMQEYVCEANRYYRDPQTGENRLRLFDESARP